MPGSGVTGGMDFGSSGLAWRPAENVIDSNSTICGSSDHRKGRGSARTSRLLALALILPLVSSALVVLGDMPGDSGRVARESYTPHSVIIIASDADFASFPGDGSEGNPYVIEGFDIDAAGFASCVLIQGTVSHFVLRDCYLHGASTAGLSLVDVVNGLIENVTCTSNRDGTDLARCTNCVLSSVNCSSNSENGLYVTQSSDLTIQSCEFSQNTRGARVEWWTNNTTITDSTINDNYMGGVYMYRGFNNTISSNNMTATGVGIQFSYCGGNLLSSNLIRNGGIRLEQSNGDMVVNNTFFETDTAIYLYNTENESLLNNTCVNGGGIYVEDYFAHSITNCTIEGNEVGYPPRQGIYMLRSHGNRISNNSCYGCPWTGIEVNGADDNIVSNNTVRDCGGGIEVFHSEGSRIEDNHCFNNSRVALEIQDTDRCRFDRNLIESSARLGAYLMDSTNSTWNDNVFTLCGLYMSGSVEAQWSTHDIPISNTVNGRPIYYLLDKVGPQSIPDPGEIILVRCSDMSIDNFEITNGTVGLEVAYSSRISVQNNTCSDNLWGILSDTTDNCTVVNNTCLRCWSNGIEMWASMDGTVEDNNASWSWAGMEIGGFRNNITRNYCNDCPGYGLLLSGTLSTASNNEFQRCGNGTYVFGDLLTLDSNNYSGDSWVGVDIAESSDVTVGDCTFIDVPIGVELQGSVNCTAFGNEFVNSGFFLAYSGEPLHSNSHTIDATNSVNGLPVFYAKNTNGVSVPAGVGQAIVVSCQNVIVHDQELTHTTAGLQLEFCVNVIAYNLNCSGNVFGMYLGGCDGGWFYDNNCSQNSMNGMFIAASGANVIRNNLFSRNGEFGMIMSNDAGLSSLNVIYNNTFAYNNGATDIFDANHVQAYDMSSSDSWNITGSPHGYGNYWSDWTGPDGDGDGIVDYPYNITSVASDQFPLTSPTVPFVFIPEFSLLFAVIPTVAGIVMFNRILQRSRRRGSP